LKAELALIKGEDQKDFLDQYDIEDCHKKVDNYLNSSESQVVLVFNDRLMAQ
jgi:kinesin family protein 6/9